MLCSYLLSIPQPCCQKTTVHVRVNVLQRAAKRTSQSCWYCKWIITFHLRFKNSAGLWCRMQYESMLCKRRKERNGNLVGFSALITSYWCRHGHVYCNLKKKTKKKKPWSEHNTLSNLNFNLTLKKPRVNRSCALTGNRVRVGLRRLAHREKLHKTSCTTVTHTLCTSRGRRLHLSLSTSKSQQTAPKKKNQDF